MSTPAPSSLIATWQQGLATSAAGTWHRRDFSTRSKLLYPVLDLACVLLISPLIFWGWSDWLADSRPAAHQQVSGPLPGFLIVYAVLVVLSLHSQDLYSSRMRSLYDEVIAVFRGTALATILLSFFVYLSGVKNVSRLLVGLDAFAVTFGLLEWRLLNRKRVLRRVAQGLDVRNVLIIGAGKVGQTLARYFDENRGLGFVVKGFLDNEARTGDQRLLGRVEELHRVARANFVDDVFITIPSERDLVKNVALEARRDRLSVKVVPELYDGLAWQAAIGYAGGFPVVELHGEPIPAFGLLLKRTLDVFISMAALVVLAPVLLMIAVLIKLDSRGPVLYRSTRVGKKGRHFTCYKFRSMVCDAESKRDCVTHLNERKGLLFKAANDPRITRLGRFLRKYSLDELLQFWNVLKGEMSIVGPRPPIVGEYQQYGLDHLRRLDVLPGITGLWQIRARRDPSFDKYLGLDLEYIENWSIWLDLKILLQTIPVVCKGTGQ
jgi:exopolysaccharide biosynthesis polyprenyl glycosylphosphotransferase